MLHDGQHLFQVSGFSIVRTAPKAFACLSGSRFLDRPPSSWPGLDGFATLRALKADRRTATIPTVALTAQAMTGDKEAALAAGFHDYISKPIDTRTFSQIVARVLTSAA